MEIAPITLEGRHVRLEPLSLAHEESLIEASNDGELWKSTVTIVPTRATIRDYITSTLSAQQRGTELPFAIIRKSSNQVVGSTRFYSMDCSHRRAEIGYTWLAKSAQRSEVNTEAKLLLLTHAFETWRCIRVAFVTDAMNQQSRAALVRIGAKFEGIIRNHMIMPSGRLRDSACYSIIESEWRDVKTHLNELCKGQP